MEDKFLRLLAIIQESRMRKEYKTADSLKKWIEELFDIEIIYTKDYLAYRKRKK